MSVITRCLVLGPLRSPTRGKPARHNGPFLMLLFESVALEGEGYTLAATDAQRRQAFLGVALDHFMQ